MTNKKHGIALFPLALLAAGVLFTGHARADDAAVDQQSKIGSAEKEIAKDQKDVSSTQADLKTKETQLKEDSAKFGADSDEVKKDQKSVTDLKKQMAGQKADEQKGEIDKNAQSAGKGSSDSTSY